MRRFGSPARFVRELIYGPEPVGAAGAAVLQGYSAGQLNGGRLSGTPHYGMKGDPSISYTGLVASPQRFQGAAQMGATPTVPVEAYPALPNATSPAALPTWLQDWTEMEGILS
ncbi:MAG TPA: hypothetical protein VHW47_10220 [Acidimicrobiales bacterium]|jgi:hypothetical protein|nr:hypothetical protein [Acidimicrobiales bacterium]